jgi:hypothetical protein
MASEGTRLSPDGTQVFFSNDRPFGTTPDTGTREPGLYVVNADGGASPRSDLNSYLRFKASEADRSDSDNSSTGDR